MRRYFTGIFTGLIFALPIATGALAQTISKQVLSLDTVRKIVAAAEVEAKKAKSPLCIAVVDESGELLYFERMDGALFGTIDTAIAKAKTAARFNTTTKSIEDQVSSGHVAYAAIPGISPLAGGVPLVSGGKPVGGIGASGGSIAEDSGTAAAGAAALK